PRYTPPLHIPPLPLHDALPISATLNDSIAINIRKHAQVTRSLAELADAGAFDQALRTDAVVGSDGLSLSQRELKALLKQNKIRSFLSHAVKNRCNIVITGPTG